MSWHLLPTTEQLAYAFKTLREIVAKFIILHVLDMASFGSEAIEGVPVTSLSGKVWKRPH